MGLPIIGDIIDAVKDLAGEVIVDKDKKNEILLEIKKLEDRANERTHEQLLGQIEINKEEAKHSSIFVAGWRPFIGWVSGAGLAWTFLLSPFLEWICRLFGWTGAMPELDTQELIALVSTMLGVAAFRSYDKTQGTAAKPDHD